MKTLLTIGALVVLAAVSYYYFTLRDEKRGAQSIAIVPFQNISNSSDQDFLVDGLTEGILNSLSQQEGITVTARTSSFKFRGSDADIEEIAKKLGVRVLVDGSARIEGDSITIMVRLINAEDRMNLWSNRYEGQTEDIFALQDKIANSIAGALLPSSRRVVTKGTLNKEARELYLKGRAFWNLRTQKDLLNGVEMFEQAISEDPGFGAAYAGLADCYTALGYASFLAPKESFPKAFEAASKALQLDSTLAEAHATLGYYKFYHEWDWAEAEQEFRKAISLNPNHELVYDWYGYYLTAMQRYDEARIVFGKAITLDPLSPGIATDMGFTFYYDKQYDQAATALEAALELNPKFPLGRLWLGRVYQAKKMYNEAIAEYKQAIDATSRWPVAFAQIGNAYGVSGDHAHARAILDSLNKMRTDKFVTSYGMALVYAGLGDKDQTYQWLNRAYEERSHWLVWIKSDPRWDSFRSDPKFAELEARISLPQASE